MNTIAHAYNQATETQQNPLDTFKFVSDSHCEDEDILNSFDFDFEFDQISTPERGASPLDLIKGHLRTNEGLGSEPPYIKASRGYQTDNDIKNWFIPSQGYDAKKAEYWVAKVQMFEAGGYELTVTKKDLHALGEMMDLPRIGGKREKGEQKENDVASSVKRSKVKIRHLIKSMGCDRLLTLTRKENSPDNYWNIDDWAAAWKAFNRLCSKAGVNLQYVAVLECHKKGNYHLHAAIVGKISVNVIRKIWLLQTGGKGTGNVDISMRRNCTVYERRAGLAKYVSKYITKQLGHVEFNKKRYWSSRHKLPKPNRYVLRSEDLDNSFFEIAEFLGLNPLAMSQKVFLFPDGGGLFFSFDEGIAKNCPF